MIKPDHKDIGRRVAYMGNFAWGGPVEYGNITAIGDKVVFVRYDGQTQSASTYPQDLCWHPESEPKEEVKTYEKTKARHFRSR